MKLMKLTISAWGPYPDLVTIDFTKFKDCGLFLITGATGAGKTTIFDAISFAFFGMVSTIIRDKTMLRSDFAGAQETFVEMEFLQKNVLYKIKRSPRYERRKKRGDGFTSSPERAILWIAKREPITILQEVNQKLEEIVGVSYIQFKQIAMIAQGEFINLLLADSKERVQILRNLFHTDQYYQLQKKLTEKTLELERQIGQLEEQMKEAVACITTKKEELQQLCQWKEVNNYEQIIVGLEQEVEQSKLKIKQMHKQQVWIEEEMNFMIHQLEKKKNQESQMTSLKQKQSKLLAKKEQVKEKQNQLKQKEPDYLKRKQELELLLEENRQLSIYLPVIEEYEQLLETEEEIQKQQKNLQQQIEKEEQQKEQLIQQIEELKKQLEEGKTISLQIEKKRILLLQLQKQKEQFINLYKKEKQLAEEENQLIQLQQRFQEIKRMREEVKLLYEQAQQAYQEAAIGLAANYLKEGSPCPVCGSTIHPNRAIILEGAPDEEELKRRKQEYQNIEEKYNQILEEASLAKGKAEQTRYECLECYKNMTDNMDTINRQKEIRQKEQKLLDEIRKEEQEQQRLEQKQEQQQQIQIFYERQVQALEQQQTSLEELLLKEKEENKNFHMFSGRLEKVKETLTHSILQEKETSVTVKEQKRNNELQIKEKQNFLQEIEEQSQDLEGQLQQITIQLQQYKSEILQLTQKMKETNCNTIQDIEGQVKQKILEREELQQQKEKSMIEQHGNEKSLAILGEKIVLYRKLEQKYSILKDIEQVTKGNNNQKVPLEYYVLSVYFEDILKAANQRLFVMTEGRYQLQKVEQVNDFRTKDFLELMVFDAYTGKKRFAKTLSGGESFSAALALALGLSDIVEEHVGGIELNMMFIDEGFGNLDRQALEQALKMLLSLTENNRMIGIISHVEELKEWIEKQIIVKKSNMGSTLMMKI